MTLADVTVFQVAKEVVLSSETELARAGTEGYELFVLWTGVQTGDVFRVQTPHVPRQTSYRSDSGLCVRVEGTELHRLNRWLYDAGQILAIQIHTHPRQAYHSDTDDIYPMVTQLGGLSIVLPNFGADGFADPDRAVYRLEPSGWVLVPAPTTEQLIQVA